MICSSISSTKTFLYDIRDLRSKQNNAGYQISRSWIVYHFNLLTSDTHYCFSYASAPWCHTEKFLYSRWIYGSHLSYEICPSLLAYLYPEKLSKIGGAVFLVTPWIVYYLWAPKMTHFFKTSFSIFSICFSTLDHKIKSAGKWI